MRKHLFSEHIDDWVTACDDLKIPITATTAMEAVQKICQEPPATQLESERPEYSKEAFIDALVDFIVGDDLVCHKFYFILKISNDKIVN